MKITKRRLGEIIKEEVRGFADESGLITETSEYVMDIYQKMLQKYGERSLLEKMVEYFSDSQIMDCFRYISKQEAIEPEAPAADEEVAPELEEAQAEKA